MPRTPEEKAAARKSANDRYYAAHGDKIRARNAENMRKNGRLYRHGLTSERYEEMLMGQNYGCATCGRDDETLHIDHDHACCPGKKSCGKCVRTLLCTRCNVALGMTLENPDVLRGLALYAERWKVA